MPPYKTMLSTDQLRDVVDYLRALAQKPASGP
jgi:mono/diheme cytochrome c family protein